MVTTKFRITMDEKFEISEFTLIIKNKSSGTFAYSVYIKQFKLPLNNFKPSLIRHQSELGNNRWVKMIISKGKTQPADYFSVTRGRTIFVINIFLWLGKIFPYPKTYFSQQKNRMYQNISVDFTSRSKAEK